jgi:hypothetical protein
MNRKRNNKQTKRLGQNDELASSVVVPMCKFRYKNLAKITQQQFPDPLCNGIK